MPRRHRFRHGKLVVGPLYTDAERDAIYDLLARIGEEASNAMFTLEAKVPPELQSWHDGQVGHWHRLLTTIQYMKRVADIGVPRSKIKPLVIKNRATRCVRPGSSC